MRTVLDGSVAAKWYFAEPGHEAADRILAEGIAGGREKAVNTVGQDCRHTTGIGGDHWEPTGVGLENRQRHVVDVRRLDVDVGLSVVPPDRIGINAPGDYMRDYAQKPGEYALRVVEKAVAGTYEHYYPAPGTKPITPDNSKTGNQ